MTARKYARDRVHPQTAYGCFPDNQSEWIPIRIHTRRENVARIKRRSRCGRDVGHNNTDPTGLDTIEMISQRLLANENRVISLTKMVDVHVGAQEWLAFTIGQ